uniref:Serine-threonine/tyrosine-protein kinase catalytic domain-containing protein n=1 Tax=Triticum urartu TaxID=4572 RepID=A0A8R7RB23_TRIUA
YSLGLLIIEITTGEKNCPENNQPSVRNFIDNVQKNWTTDYITSKYSILTAYGLHQVKQCIKIGLECVTIDRKGRPTIEKIIDTLKGIN